MPDYIQNYRKKLTSALEQAQINDLNLSNYIELRRCIVSLRCSTRLRKKEDEQILWESVEIDNFIARCSLSRLQGKPLDLFSACLVGAFTNLEDKYGECPDDIAQKVKVALKNN